ncbi:TlpA family protein disulfide reductase [Singulisphaera rosea]
MIQSIIALAALSLGQELPRYQFEVGQKITYAGKAESRYKAEKYEFNSDETEEWAVWVVRDNPDGSWRLLLRSSKAATRLGPKGVRTAGPAETSLGYLDIGPDGKIIPNRSIGYHFDPLRLFPEMPATSSEKGWEGRVEWDASKHHYTPISPTTSDLSFRDTIESPIGRVSLTTTTVDYSFDKGMVQRLEARKTREYITTGSETETLELKTVEKADVEQLGRESDVFFDALAAYWDLEDRSAVDPSKHAEAGAILAELRDRLTVPLFRQRVDSLLARYRQSSGSSRTDEFAQMIGKPGPEWEAKDIDGKSHSTKDLRGNVVILDFWSRGCGWCIRAMPQLKALREEFEGRPVQLLGMSLDEKEEDARLVVEQMRITYPTVRAAGLSEGYKVGGIPHLVILDQEGRIADIHIGYAPMLKERVTKSVRKLLDRK